MSAEELLPNGKVKVKALRWSEFDCPVCDANNPWDEFGVGEEVVCMACGCTFKVSAGPDGALNLQEG